ncbi:hypothetical protein KC19_4G003000 [Ceratodon purpureus]|uniref:Uncharacterized protein n=1 Tax=Ceratodon purpureus TaxID=3225 RepID=A0A8T0I4Z3_CERPU|nr:hypothetical protein KC19_4G003000 [Ceratodon purpureus]
MRCDAPGPWAMGHGNQAGRGRQAGSLHHTSQAQGSGLTHNLPWSLASPPGGLPVCLLTAQCPPALPPSLHHLSHNTCTNSLTLPALAACLNRNLTLQHHSHSNRLSAHCPLPTAPCPFHHPPGSRLQAPLTPPLSLSPPSFAPPLLPSLRLHLLLSFHFIPSISPGSQFLFPYCNFIPLGIIASHYLFLLPSPGGARRHRF